MTKHNFPVLVFVAVLCLATSISSIELDQDDDGILIIKSSQWEEAIASYNYLFIKFYSSYNCPRSDKLVPHFLKAWETVQDDPEKPSFAKIDVMYDDKKFTEFGFRVTPMLVFCEHGRCTMYNGPIDYKSLAKYMRKKTQSPVIRLKNSQAVLDFLKTKDFFFVYFGAEEGPKFEDYKKVAKIDDLLDYCICKEKDCLERFSAEEGTMIAFRKNLEPREVVLKDVNEDNIRDFVIKYGFPKIFNYTEAVGDIIFARRVPAIIFIRDTSVEDHRTIEEILRRNIDQFDNKLKLVFSGLDTEDEITLAKNFDIESKSQLPHLRIVDQSNGDLKMYQYEGTINDESLLSWFSKWQNGILRQTLMSEAIPKEEQTGLVKKVVSRNFGDKVINTENSSVVLFYSSDHLDTQGASVELYEELAKEIVATYPSVEFFKIDSSKNNVQEALTIGVGLKIFVFRSGDKKNNSHVYEDMKNFTKEKIKDFLKVHLADQALDLKASEL